jgi:hypothetical protein
MGRAHPRRRGCTGCDQISRSRRQMLDVALDIQLRLLTFGRCRQSNERKNARADPLDYSLDRAPCPRHRGPQTRTQTFCPDPTAERAIVESDTILLKYWLAQPVCASGPGKLADVDRPIGSGWIGAGLPDVRNFHAVVNVRDAGVMGRHWVAGCGHNRSGKDPVRLSTARPPAVRTGTPLRATLVHPRSVRRAAPSGGPCCIISRTDMDFAQARDYYSL